MGVNVGFILLDGLLVTKLTTHTFSSIQIYNLLTIEIVFIFTFPNVYLAKKT